VPKKYRFSTPSDLSYHEQDPQIIRESFQQRFDAMKRNDKTKKKHWQQWRQQKRLKPVIVAPPTQLQMASAIVIEDEVTI
jgi:hypothetical protein